VHPEQAAGAIASRSFGDNRKSILKDLAILTGGADKPGIKLERTTTDLLGSTGLITITEVDTIVLLNGEGAKDTIQVRCEPMWNILADPTTSEFNKTECLPEPT
jgi:chaperonin GroEL